MVNGQWKRSTVNLYSLTCDKTIKLHLEMYRVLQVISKWKTLKQHVYILKVVEVWPTFDIQINIALVIFWKKAAKPHFLEIALSTPQKYLKACQHSDQ